MTVATEHASDLGGPPKTLLGRALMGNGVFSGTSGLVMMLGAAGLDSWLGVNTWLLVGIGAALIVFAIDLSIWARSKTWQRRGGLIAIAGDTLWVLGALTLIFATDVLTSAGQVALGAVTAVVAAFAVLQTIGLTKLEDVA
jgi:hypothetical protein